MWTFLKAGMSFLPSLGGWWLYLAVAVVSASLASVGTYKVEHWRSLAAIATVQSAFDHYKLQVLSDVNDSNQKTQNGLATLNKSLNQIQSQLKSQSVRDRQTSEALIERLQHENGKSCPLSPAVIEYLNSLRGTHPTPSH